VLDPLTAAGHATELRIELGVGSGVIGPMLPAPLRMPVARTAS